MNKEKLEQAAKLLIEAIGDDPKREGLFETPKRFAEMIQEQFAYVGITNDEIAKKFYKTFETTENDIVIVKQIPIFSHCEHHIAIMYNMKVSIGYKPKGRVIGLSKMARIADAVGKRFQIQERIGTDIREIMKKITKSEDVIVHISGEHSCMTARGIQKPGAVTETIASSGIFKENYETRAEFLKMVKN